MSENASPSPIRLISSDGKEFLVDSTTGEDHIPTIPLSEVRSDVLTKVIEYCEHHKDSPGIIYNEYSGIPFDIYEWDKLYFNVDDQGMLFGIILAANYLDIRPLVIVGCKTVANMIKGKSPDEIIELFHIEEKDRFTKEELAEMNRELTDEEWLDEYNRIGK